MLGRGGESLVNCQGLVEQREKAGAELEAALSTRESDLSMYVSQLQDNFDRRESEWWSKQLGKDAGQQPAA